MTRSPHLHATIRADVQQSPCATRCGAGGAWQPLSGWHTKHDYVPDLRIADNRLGMGLFLVAAYHRAR